MSLIDQVEAALDTIRPYLEADGGNVSVEEITPEGVVKLKLLGFMRIMPHEHHDA
jgi:Fe-S cluster biogenesis protein NfuA